MSAFARLTALMQHVADAGGLEDTVEFPAGATKASPAVELLLVDVAVVLERLADLCPDHSACVTCERVMCLECEVGGEPSCGHGWPLVCEDCDPTDVCGDCYVDRRAMGVEARLGGAA